MSPESPGSMGLEDARWAGDDRPEDNSDDDDDWPEDHSDDDDWRGDEAGQAPGKVTSIGSVKVGDVVSAQIRESGGKATATAIQDPARQLSSGDLPPIGGSLP